MNVGLPSETIKAAAVRIKQLERENAALRVENAALKKALDRLEQKFAAIDAARKEEQA